MITFLVLAFRAALHGQSQLIKDSIAAKPKCPVTVSPKEAVYGCPLVPPASETAQMPVDRDPYPPKDEKPYPPIKTVVLPVKDKGKSQEAQEPPVRQSNNGLKAQIIPKGIYMPGTRNPVVFAPKKDDAELAEGETGTKDVPGPSAMDTGLTDYQYHQNNGYPSVEGQEQLTPSPSFHYIKKLPPRKPVATKVADTSQKQPQTIVYANAPQLQPKQPIKVKNPRLQPIDRQQKPRYVPTEPSSVGTASTEENQDRGKVVGNPYGYSFITAPASKPKPQKQPNATVEAKKGTVQSGPRTYGYGIDPNAQKAVPPPRLSVPTPRSGGVDPTNAAPTVAKPKWVDTATIYKPGRRWVWNKKKNAPKGNAQAPSTRNDIASDPVKPSENPSATGPLPKHPEGPKKPTAAIQRGPPVTDGGIGPAQQQDTEPLTPPVIVKKTPAKQTVVIPRYPPPTTVKPKRTVHAAQQPCVCPPVAGQIPTQDPARPATTAPPMTAPPRQALPRSEYKVNLLPDGKYNLTFLNNGATLTVTPFGRIASVSLGQNPPQYNYRGLLESLGGLPLQYTYEGRLLSVGGTVLGYNYNGNIESVGNMPLLYNYNGTIDKIGNAKVNYDANGNVSGTSGNNPVIAQKQ